MLSQSQYQVVVKYRVGVDIDRRRLVGGYGRKPFTAALRRLIIALHPLVMPVDFCPLADFNLLTAENSCRSDVYDDST
jgi:hypothetical protein